MTDIGKVERLRAQLAAINAEKKAAREADPMWRAVQTNRELMGYPPQCAICCDIYPAEGCLRCDSGDRDEPCSCVSRNEPIP